MFHKRLYECNENFSRASLGFLERELDRGDFLSGMKSVRVCTFNTDWNGLDPCRDPFSFSLSYVLRGAACYTLDGHDHEVSMGDLVCIPPHEFSWLRHESPDYTVLVLDVLRIDIKDGVFLSRPCVVKARECKLIEGSSSVPASEIQLINSPVIPGINFITVSTLAEGYNMAGVTGENERGFYVLEGHAVFRVSTSRESCAAGPDDFVCIPAWRRCEIKVVEGPLVVFAWDCKEVQRVYETNEIDEEVLAQDEAKARRG